MFEVYLPIFQSNDKNCYNKKNDMIIHNMYIKAQISGGLDKSIQNDTTLTT